MAIEIEEGGQSAIVNGRQVAKAGVDPQVWKKIEEGSKGTSRREQARATAGLAAELDVLPWEQEGTPTDIGPQPVPGGSGGRARRRAQARDAPYPAGSDDWRPGDLSPTADASVPASAAGGAGAQPSQRTDGDKRLRVGA